MNMTIPPPLPKPWGLEQQPRSLRAPFFFALHILIAVLLSLSPQKGFFIAQK